MQTRAAALRQRKAAALQPRPGQAVNNLSGS